MALEISFLGPLQVLAADAPVRLVGHRRIGVLARLAMNAGQPVHAERILTDIWGDSSAATAAKQLHIVISKLRRALGPHTAEEIIQTVPGGYRLVLVPDHIDAHLPRRKAGASRNQRPPSLRGVVVPRLSGARRREVPCLDVRLDRRDRQRRLTARHPGHGDDRVASLRPHLEVAPDRIPEWNAVRLRA
ncbi:AfsR/SARP family transcriptional regulator [Nonomuraea diastatica]|uniref:Helix-turn-helix domain-containing protein n=1 Tax=Nonomuraea diastatica TaxID=1848329 RepID=A0A4R4WN93_9ACTN|nr:helix-turn-helix domain-containing protein [Nonomuraea diastatica]TDD17375.1 helix-turn-helix domain-containing protein [Nonomuraea diastatica]